VIKHSKNAWGHARCAYIQGFQNRLQLDICCASQQSKSPWVIAYKVSHPLHRKGGINSGNYYQITDAELKNENIIDRSYCFFAYDL